MKKIIIFCLAVLMILSFAACNDENGAKQVPDSVLKDFVATSAYYNSNYDYSLKSVHDWDEEANRDSVAVTLTVNGDYGTVSVNGFAVFEYDKSSDLWSIVKQTEWSEPYYSFNNNLCGSWNIEYFNSNYNVDVVSVGKEEIKLEVVISEYVQSYFDSAYCSATASGSYQINNNWVKVSFGLPENFYVSWRETASGENEFSSDLNIELDIHKGLSQAYVYPSINIQ